MKQAYSSTLIFFGIIFFGIMACFPMTMLALPLFRPDRPAADDPAATLQVIVAQTVQAMTQNAPTPTSVPPTATLPPPTPTSVPPTSTPPPTATQVSYCDWITFVKDVSIPDGTKLLADDTFTKTWRLKNRGTCTWTPDYMLVFVNGDSMGGTTSVRLPGYVSPGQSIDISITLTAPARRGRYVGYWMLRNTSGLLFGFGESANKAFYVDIFVEDLPHGEVTGKFQYPSEFNPPLTLYFENAVNGDVIQFSIPESSPTYKVLLPAGTYYAYAWALGYNLQGAYVFENLTMKPFVVKAGQTLYEINLTDWSPYPHSRGQ